MSMQDILIFIGVLGAAWLFLTVIMNAVSNPKARMKKRIARLAERKQIRPKTAEEALSLRRKQSGKQSAFMTLLMKPLPNFEKLNVRLERAGSKLSAKQFMFRSLLAIIVITTLFVLTGKSFIIGICVGFVLAVWLPLKWINRKINKQQKAFLIVFPDAIDLIVRGLRSGLPVSESIKLVATEVPEPVAGVFEHVSNIMKLGVSLEKALQEIAKQLNYTEFNFFVTSIILQRETGGNLSEILNNLADVLRKRHLMKMKIKALTSEARASAIIVGSLPFFVAGAVSILSPNYIKPLFTDYRGNYALIMAGVFMFMGITFMRKMAKFEI